MEGGIEGEKEGEMEGGGWRGGGREERGRESRVIFICSSNKMTTLAYHKSSWKFLMNLSKYSTWTPGRGVVPTCSRSSADVVRDWMRYK